MVEYILGILSATIAMGIAYLIDCFRIRKQVLYAMRPEDHVASFNATVLVDDEGAFAGWIDNTMKLHRFGGDDHDDTGA